MKGRLLVAILLLALVISTCVNVWLGKKALNSYWRMTEVMLDLPSGSGPEAHPRDSISNGRAIGQLVFFGDSRISEWRDLPKIDGVRSVNLGRGGDTTAMALRRMERDILSVKPEVVVLQIGINDLKAIGVLPERGEEIVRSAKRNIAQMVSTLAGSDIDVVVLTVFPPGSAGLLRRPIWSNKIEEAVAEVNGYIRALRGERVTVVDCDALLAVGGRLRRKYEKNTLHINAAGYMALNSILGSPLQEIVSARTFRSEPD